MKTDERPAAAEDQGQDAERDRIRRALRYCLWVFLGMRIGLSLLSLAGVALLPTLEPVGVPGWAAHDTTQGWHNLFTAWERFDALWFLRIADTGYVDGDGSAVFYPGYPLVVRLFSLVLGGHPLAGGLLVSHLATFGSLVLLYFLTAAEWSERVARRTVLYLAIFPTSFFLLAPYSESLFLFLVLLALWSARRGKWELAGLGGIGASATRNIGVLLVLPLLTEAIHRFHERRDGSELARGLVWSLLAAGGAVGYLIFWQLFSGDPLAPVVQQANWQRELTFPLETLLRGTREAFRFIGVYPGGYHLLDWLIVIPALGAAVWVALRARPVYTVYTLASLLAPLFYAFSPRPFMSIPRFLLPLFPLVWAVAVWAERRKGVHETYLAVSGALLGVMLVLFVNWYYVF
ncbi:MAG: mannosyltransferase family protein [Actinomycetota bacterium]